MYKKLSDLFSEDPKINILGNLVILAIGILAGVLFTKGIVSWALVVLLGGGFVGMILAWMRSPKRKK